MLMHTINDLNGLLVTIKIELSNIFVYSLYISISFVFRYNNSMQPKTYIGKSPFISLPSPLNRPNKVIGYVYHKFQSLCDICSTQKANIYMLMPDHSVVPICNICVASEVKHQGSAVVGICNIDWKRVRKSITICDNGVPLNPTVDVGIIALLVLFLGRFDKNTENIFAKWCGKISHTINHTTDRTNLTLATINDMRTKIWCEYLEELAPKNI